MFDGMSGLPLGLHYNAELTELQTDRCLRIIAEKTRLERVAQTNQSEATIQATSKLLQRMAAVVISRCVRLY